MKAEALRPSLRYALADHADELDAAITIEFARVARPRDGATRPSDRAAAAADREPLVVSTLSGGVGDIQ